MASVSEIAVPLDDDDADVAYVDDGLHADASRHSIESGVFDLDEPVPGKVVLPVLTAKRKSYSILDYFSSNNVHIETVAEATRKRAASQQKVSSAKKAKADKKDAREQPTVADQLQRQCVVPPIEASLRRIVRLAAEQGFIFNAEKLLVLRKLCDGSSHSVFGLPGTAKTSTLAFALDELPDTWVFSNAGVASNNLLETYARQRYTDVKTAREGLREKNVVIKHYDAFFAILPSYRSYVDWEKNTLKSTLALLLEHFRKPATRIVFEEACNIPYAKYDMIDKICNKMAKEVHEERIRKGAPKKDYIPRYMAADTVCFYGDPRQLVPTDPFTHQPERLMDSPAYAAAIDKRNRLSLTKVERQDDVVFQRVVALVGNGIMNDEVQLFMRTLKVIPSPRPEDGVVICPYRVQAREHNDRIVDSIAAETHERGSNLVRSYAVVCQYDSLADSKIRKKKKDADTAAASATATGREGPQKRIGTHWMDVTDETNGELYRRILLGGKSPHEAGIRKTDYRELATPVRLKLGTTCIYGTNHKKFEHLVNGTRVVIVGWDKKNMPIVSLEDAANEYREEHGKFGYDPETLKTGVTIVVKYTTSNFKVFLQKVPATDSSPAVPGKMFSCRKIEMKLRPAYAFTAHKSQGKSIKRTVIDPTPSKQFAPGIFFVALTRSVHPPALLAPIPPNFTINVDKKAIEQCREIEANMQALCEENGIEWDLDDSSGVESDM